MKRSTIFPTSMSRALIMSGIFLGLLLALPPAFCHAQYAWEISTGSGTTYNNDDAGDPKILYYNRVGMAASHLTQSGAITGNIKFLVEMDDVLVNNNRLSLTSAGNTFSGGMEVINATVRTTLATGALGTAGIVLNRGVIMSGNASLDVNNPITLTNWGGFRAGNNMTVSGKITGTGDLVLLTDGRTSVGTDVAPTNKITTLTYSGNDYTGVTSIGTVEGQGVTSGQNDTFVRLKLGASNVLPATTVVEIGKSQLDAYKFVSSHPQNSQLILGDGTENTIAGLYGPGQVVGENGTNVNKLNINVAGGKSYEFTGAITGGTGGGVSISLGGTGTQIIGGTVAAANTVNFTVNAGTLELAKTAAVNTAYDVTVNNGGTLVIADNGTKQQISNRLTVTNGGTVDLNGGDFQVGSLGGGTAATYSGVITNTSSEKSILTISSNDANANYHHNAKISGNIDIVKTAGNRQRFNNTLDFTGDTTIQGGIFNLHAADIWKNTTGKIIFTGDTMMTLMLNADNTFENDIVLESGNANLRTGNSAKMTLNGVISGSGNLYINSGENGGGQIHLNGDNIYTGDTEFRGTGTATVYAHTDNAFGEGRILIDNSNATGMAIQFDTDTESRTIGNDLHFTGANRKIKLTKSSGDHQALYTGNLSGAGTLTSTGIDYLIDLDQFFVSPDAVNAIWEGLTGNVTFDDDVTFYLASSDWDALGGAEFSLFDNAQVTGLLTEDNFDFYNAPAGMFEMTVGDLSSGAWGVSLQGSSVSATPEPATWVMMLLGAAGIVVLRRKR